MTIISERLKLVACDASILEQAINGNYQLSRLLKVNIAPEWTEFGVGALRYALERVSSGADQAGWWTYLPILHSDNTLIGSGGYKGRPSMTGEVEIGYEIAPRYRGRGLATEMAGRLITHAFTNPDVSSIAAHTLAGENASVSVLKKCGFVQVDEFADAEAGLVWKWVLARNR
jgi:RimJ/RimL family protein N-acetyltransferase